MVKTASPRRQVSNEEYQSALHNSDNAALLRSIAGGYSRQLSRDELHSCSLRALWRALQYYQPEKGQKFTSSLHTFMTWECRRALERKKTDPTTANTHELAMDKPVREEDFNSEDMEHIRERMKRLPEAQRLVIEQYFLKGMTLKEIGEANRYSKEIARRHLRRGLDRLRELCWQGL